jgi:cold shock CspA family protein
VIGRVRLWNGAKGLGLIETEDRQVYRVWRDDVPWGDDLRRGQLVEFLPSRCPSGPRARAVRPLGLIASQGG